MSTPAGLNKLAVCGIFLLLSAAAAAPDQRPGRPLVGCGVLSAGRTGAGTFAVVWKDSTSAERLDLRNGLAACPSHDVAFDTGLLTVDASLQVHISGPLADAVRADRRARQYYGRPPLRDTILLPD